MLSLFLWIALGLAGCLALLPIVGTLRFRSYVKAYLRADRNPFTPKLSVIMPCKGIDPGFGENIISLMEQDYPDFELLFVTATEADPAHVFLRDLLEKRVARNARLLVAGIRQDRSQKLNNQLYACAHVRPESAALVFVDSDVRAHPAFLRDLVAPLADTTVGATTGFRWYIPGTGGLGSYLRATWNGGGLPMLADPKLAYAWGGSMGILRTTFEEANVPRCWQNALTDDFPLTRAVRELGRSVRFVPQCLLGSHEDCSVSEVVEWTNRQTVICRVYNRPLWRGIFTFHALSALALLVAAAALASKAIWPELPINIWPAVGMFGMIPAEMAAGMSLWQTVHRLLPQVGGWGRAFKHACLAPAAVLLIFYNSIRSLLTNKIRWRGVVYRLHSPVRTEVITAT